MLALRAAALLAAVAAFAGFSVRRFTDFGNIRPPLDLASQSDQLTEPARRYLGSRLRSGTPIGCLDRNPDWPDECDYFFYSLLPDFAAKIEAGNPPSQQYVMFAADPHAPQSPREQATDVSGYRVELELAQSVFLLRRGEP